MRESELIREISLRAGVSRPAVRTVLAAFLDLVREARDVDDELIAADSAHESSHRIRRPVSIQAASARLKVAKHSEASAVEELIARARKHTLGIEFLREGYLASVAAEFGAHAFTVEAARHRLANERRQSQRRMDNAT